MIDEAAFQQALCLLANRKKRVGIYAGMGCQDCSPELVAVAEMLQAPVATNVSGKGVIPESHPLAVGWGYGPFGTRTAERAFADVDIVLAIGVRYSEVSTAFYSTPKHPCVIQVDINQDNLGRIVKPACCVHAEAGAFLAKLRDHAPELQRCTNGKLISCIKDAKHDEYYRNLECLPKCGVDPLRLILAMRRCLSPDALLFVDVTTSEHWAAEVFQTVQPRTYFNPTDNQSMGWSIPAALGAQMAFPCRQVATLTGDGCFLMSGMELATAGRLGLPVKFFVLDDQAYHLMQALQKPAYRRATATVLPHIDYAAFAKAVGVGYHEVVRIDDLEASVRGVLCTKGPVLAHVRIDYGDRCVRWIEAAKTQFANCLTKEQKMRFLCRIAGRSLHVKQCND